MPKEPITKTLKWLMAIGAFAVIGLLYFAYLDTNDQLELAGMRDWWPARKKTNTAVVSGTPTPTAVSLTPTTSVESALKTYSKKNATTGYTLSFQYPSAWTISSEAETNGTLEVKMKSGDVAITVMTPLQGRGLCEGADDCPYDFPKVENANLGTFNLAVSKNKTSYMAPSPNGPDTAEGKTVELDASGTLTTEIIASLDAVVKSLNLTK